MKNNNILIVDDEEHILELLSYNLQKNGFKTTTCITGERAIEILKNQEVDMVLLDLMLPGIDGTEVLKYIRNTKQLKRLPVIMLTAKNEEIDKVVGLELGADDYLGKPFGIYELVARIKALFRRSNDLNYEEKNMDRITFGDLVINKINRQVKLNNEVIQMPLKEFELLYLLAKNPGRVFSREFLLETIWGYEYSGETRTVDVHIRNIRKKIENDDKNPKYIKTLRGVGYKFVEE